MPIASRLAPTGSVVFTHFVCDPITVGASLLAMAHHAIFTPGVRVAGITRLGVSSEATGYAQ